MATITNTADQKAAALAKFDAITEETIGHTNYLGGHIMWVESDGDIELFSVWPYFNNIKAAHVVVDNPNKKISFLIEGIDQSTAISFNDSGNRLVAGV